MSLSPRHSLAGKRLLVTGASGFLGKVWLAQLLLDVPDVARVHVLLRPGRAGGARERLEELLSASPAFAPLHDAHGEALGRILAGRITALEGDVGRPLLGLSDAILEGLGDLDLVVHLAGLTDLEPDLPDALRVNVDGALQALEVARRTGAALLHVSTAYVAGERRGRVSEEPCRGAPRADAGFDARREQEDLRALVARTEAAARDQRTQDALRRDVRRRLARQGRQGAAAEARAQERSTRAWVADRLRVEAGERARHWGWPNAYTLTKGLAEALLVQASAGQVPLLLARPTIVESALRFPFPGWKEGLQTSAALCYAVSRGLLTRLPARPHLVLDVIPVDLVARGLTLCAAALVSGATPPNAAVHLGTSDRNPLTMRRLIDLTNLWRRSTRTPDQRAASSTRGALDRWLRPEAIPSSAESYRLLGTPLGRRLSGAARDALDAASRALPADVAERARRWSRAAGRSERKLARLEATIETFRPFVLEHEQTFSADGLRALEAQLDPAERERFAVDADGIDWRRYWLEVHLPGLQRWAFPLLEGRRPAPWPRRTVKLQAAEATESAPS
jgi:long-chain acyl-CoA synthetase